MSAVSLLRMEGITGKRPSPLMLCYRATRSESLKPATLGSYMYCTVAFIISSATETNVRANNEFPVQGYGGRQRQVWFAPGSLVTLPVASFVCLYVQTQASQIHSIQPLNSRCASPPMVCFELNRCLNYLPAHSDRRPISCESKRYLPMPT